MVNNFQKYHQNKQPPFASKSLNIKKIMTYDICFFNIVSDFLGCHWYSITLIDWLFGQQQAYCHLQHLPLYILFLRKINLQLFS